MIRFDSCRHCGEPLAFCRGCDCQICGEPGYWPEDGPGAGEDELIDPRRDPWRLLNLKRAHRGCADEVAIEADRMLEEQQRDYERAIERGMRG